MKGTRSDDWVQRRVDRRYVLWLAGILGATTATGCDLLATDPGENGNGSRRRRKGPEAPQLAQLADAGELPPVEQRLPGEPLVVEPTDRIGVYGGTWRTALVGFANTYWLNVTIGYEGLLRWRPDTEQFTDDEVVPNVAEDFEVNEEKTRFVFHLREGMKWSDGIPFTADDIMFWAEDVLFNEELSPEIPSWLQAGGEPVVVEKVDDYTVTFRFAESSGLFLQNMATGRGRAPAMYPRHYLEQFHKKYNPNIDDLVEEEGFAEWVELFGARADVWSNGESPVLHAWMLVTPLGESTRVVAERNPFYWKTDREGSQLPYIDQVVFEVVEDAEVILLNTLNGEIDMHLRGLTTPENKPVLAQSREEGDYRFFDTVPDGMNTVVISLNLTHKDPTMREIFQNKDFRIGLSHAIDRKEIVDLVFVSQGEPWQAAPRPESKFYDEEFAKQYTEYDVDMANEFLDRVLPEKDSEGMRIGPDGKTLSFQVAATNAPVIPYAIDVLEVVREYWTNVGIDMRVRSVERSYLNTLREANEHDASVWGGNGGLGVVLNPRWYFPFAAGFGSHFALPWAEWFVSRGQDGEQPPAAVRQQMELYYQLLATADEKEREELMLEILRIAKDQFLVMGVSLPVGYGIVKNNFHNVPEKMLDGDVFQDPASTNPPQYFIQE